jgi:hypothetical protein
LPEDRPVRLELPLEEAEAVHAALEDLLEAGTVSPNLHHPRRILAWRILAAKTGTGLTARLAELARRAGTLEQYETARDDELGPILDGLESAENRDP